MFDKKKSHFLSILTISKRYKCNKRGFEPLSPGGGVTQTLVVKGKAIMEKITFF